VIGIIGGSGLYALFDDARTEKVTTPYGEPSATITVAEVDGRPVAFLPRHGEDHRFPAHRVPYRANLWALRALGCRQILAPCAVGGLRPEFGPGTFVLPDQLVDRTTGRDHTFYDDGAVHVTFADPYCPALREAVSTAAATTGQALHHGGTVVVIDGPRFSTRAESRWYAAAGGTVVNMTAAPEAALARELALCYATVALVTDVDAGVDGERGVSQDEVFAVFARNIERLRRLLLASVAAAPVARSCSCPSALDGMTLPFALP
jgi:5'-methylthioadenosine phosphorylase